MRESREREQPPVVGSPSDAFFVATLAAYPTITNLPRKASRPPQYVYEYEEA